MIDSWGVARKFGQFYGFMQGKQIYTHYLGGEKDKFMQAFALCIIAWTLSIYYAKAGFQLIKLILNLYSVEKGCTSSILSV